MRLRRPIAFILSAAVAASALTGCDSFSGHAAAAANSAQVQQLIEFIADLGLERDLRQALQKGGDLRQALLTLLGLESAVNFNVDGLAGARPGQHAVQVWEVTAQSAEDAAALAASQIRAVLEQLKSSGVTEGRIGMVEVDGKYYVVVDVEVTEENTFEPIRPASDDDDDSEDTPSASAPTAMVDGKPIDLSSLGTEITADEILELAGKDSSEKNSITELDLSGCTELTSIGEYAFQNCKKLTTVTLPSFVTTIGNYAFVECDSLEEINLGNCTGLTSIGNYAFAFSDLTEINLSGCTSLDIIGDGAFGGCQSLTSIDLSNTQVNTIDNNAFFDCTSLKTVKLPAKLTTIGNCAFQNCASLGTVLLPESLGEIGAQAFWDCTDLQSIYFQSAPDIAINALKDVIAEGLTVYYNPSTCDLTELKAALEKGGLSSLREEQFQSFDPNELSTLASFFDL